MDVLAFHQSLPSLSRILCRTPDRPIHVHYARIQGWRTFRRTMMNDSSFIFEPNANIRPQLFLPPTGNELQANYLDLIPSAHSFLL
eukprot:symbB.v1.2.025828.t1/scaffold2534.1/size76752/1